MDIFEKVRTFIHDLVGVPLEDISLESTPQQLNMDMFDVEELVLELEDEYGVIIDNCSCSTINDLVEQVMAA